MYHYYFLSEAKRKSGAASCSAAVSILLFLALLAVLICNAAGSLACRLARSLALTASAGDFGLSHISCCYCFDSLHF
jgi:hypothetical protein